MRNRKWMIGIAAALLPLLCVSGCQATSKVAVKEDTIYIPGLTEEYRLAFLADMHIVEESGDVPEEEYETVAQRKELFQSADGTDSADMWSEMAGMLDGLGADAILLAGDMVDFASDGTLACLQEGLEKLETPWMYVRADHDYGVWYTTMDKKQAKALHKELDGAENVVSMDLGEVLLVGVDNNTSQISKKTLKKVKTLFSMGKPVILMLHVPLESRIDDELNQKSKEVWQDRALVWGEDTFYEPNETTQQFLEMVYAKDSPVVEVLCGHLHFSWEGYLTETVHERVADPAFTGAVELLTVTGKKEVDK